VTVAAVTAIRMGQEAVAAGLLARAVPGCPQRLRDGGVVGGEPVGERDAVGQVD
jgi:hypothetical protein